MALIYGVDFQHNVKWIRSVFYDDAEWHERIEMCALASCDNRAAFEFLGPHPFIRHRTHVCTSCLQVLAIPWEVIEPWL